MRRVFEAKIYSHDGSRWLSQECRAVRYDDIAVPLPVVFGQYEALTNEQLDELISDLEAERKRANRR